jgi:hypothetical protein
MSSFRRFRFPLLLFTLAVSTPSPAESAPGCLAAGAAVRRAPGPSFSTEGGAVEADLTLYCLSCHDGTVASCRTLGSAWRPRSHGAASAPSLLGGGLTASDGIHPVDVAYPARGAGFRSRAEVEDLLPLPGGSITCVTCHALDSGETAVLRISNDRSALCTACHVK